MDNQLTIIIVTFHSQSVIRDCLNKINFNKFRVLVIDNYSKDQTTKIVEEEFPQVTLIKMFRNIGYGRANNIGLQLTKTPYALILNPDAFMSENDIEIVLAEMEKDPKIAIAGPNISEEKSDFVENSAIKKDDVNVVAVERNGNDGYFISGSVLFLKMSVFKEIGFFDENIFLFYEDDEICLRSEANGYKNVIIKSATAFHAHGQSSPSTLRNLYRKSWHFYWSRCYFRKLNLNHGFRKSASIVLRAFVKFLISLVSFNLQKIVKNWAYFCGAFSFVIGLKAFNKNGNPRA